MPYFSIVTSAYNAQSYLKRAIESVVNQTFSDYEYIIVDNGSFDNTKPIIEEYVKKYPNIIKMISVRDNLGISGGRNQGIQQAIGTYICFLDADDYWEKSKLEVVYKQIEKNPDTNIFCHWEYHIKGDSRGIGEYRQPNNADLYKDLLINGNCLSTSAIAVNADLLKKSGPFDERLVSGEEDYDLWLRLAKAGGKVLMIGQPLGYWIIREDSVSAKHITHTEAVVRVIAKHFEDLFAETHDKSLRREKGRAIARIYCGCGRTLSTSSNRKYANKMFKMAIKICPSYLKSYAGVVLNLLHK